MWSTHRHMLAKLRMHSQAHRRRRRRLRRRLKLFVFRLRCVCPDDLFKWDACVRSQVWSSFHAHIDYADTQDFEQFSHARRALRRMTTDERGLITILSACLYRSVCGSNRMINDVLFFMFVCHLHIWIFAREQVDHLFCINNNNNNKYSALLECVLCECEEYHSRNTGSMIPGYR